MGSVHLVDCGKCGADGKDVIVSEGPVIRKYYRYEIDHPKYLDDFVDGVRVECHVCGYREEFEYE